jgi:hypothetical protein
MSLVSYRNKSLSELYGIYFVVVPSVLAGCFSANATGTLCSSLLSQVPAVKSVYGNLFSYSDALGKDSNSIRDIDIWNVADFLVKGKTGKLYFDGRFAHAGRLVPRETPNAPEWSGLLHLETSYSGGGLRTRTGVPEDAASGHRFLGKAKARIIYDSVSLVAAMEKSDPDFDMILAPNHEDTRFPGFSSRPSDRASEPLLASASIQEAINLNKQPLDLYLSKEIPTDYIQKIYIPAGFDELFFQSLKSSGISHIGGRSIYDVVEVVEPKDQKLLYVPSKKESHYDFFILRDPFTSEEAKMAAADWDNSGNRNLILGMLARYKTKYGIGFELTELEVRAIVMSRHGK